MRSDAKKTFFYQADANPLGGFIEEPFQKTVPSQASSSLPPVGGYATARSEAFNLDEFISCRSAYSRVLGREEEEDGPWTALATAAVEGLNILDVVTADRVVAQLTVDYPRDGGFARISLAGSHFENLRIGGFEAFPSMNWDILRPKSGVDAAQSQLTWPIFQRTGHEQAEKLIGSIDGGDREAFRWIIERFEWMSADRPPEEDRFALCSLVNGVDQAIPGRSFGHVVEIPDFGRIFLGELLISPASVQLIMVRAELGCAGKGQATACGTGVGGRTVPPSLA
jgi:hypothetical protein